MGVGSQMVHFPAAVDSALYGLFIADVAKDQLHAMEGQLLKRSGRQIENTYRLAALQEKPHEMTANETGTACHKNHGILLIYTGHGEIRYFFPFPPTPTLPHKGGGMGVAPSPLVGEGWGGGDQGSLPPCGGGLGWGGPRLPPPLWGRVGVGGTKAPSPLVGEGGGGGDEGSLPPCGGGLGWGEIVLNSTVPSICSIIQP